jgi:hypothetical protein
MKLSIDTEIEEIAELKHAIAIIEDAIQRREDDEDSNETQTTMESQENFQEEEQNYQDEQQTYQQPETPIEQSITEKPKQEIPSVDISALATSDYGERIEKRSMEAKAPTQDNKIVVKGIIQTLKDQSGGNPIQMQDILNLAKEKNINENEARSLVNELQTSSSI